MYAEVEQLSKTLDFLTEEDAKRIIRIVNAKIRDALGAHIIDVLWRIEGRTGAILQPYAYSDTTSRGGPKPNPVADGASRCAWIWVFNTGRPLWLEQIRSKDRLVGLREEAGGEIVEPEYLDFFEATDSMLAVPMTFRDSVRGVYTIELPVSGRLNPEVLEAVKRFVFPIANLVWKADAYKFNRNQTLEVIDAFDAALRSREFDFTIRCRSGFVARPFRPEFEMLERCLARFFRDRRVALQSYKHTPGSGIVLEDLRVQVGECHFAVVDITGLNPNVLAELGMLISLGKKFILLRAEEDAGELPFDVRPYYCYAYRVESGTTITVRDPGGEGRSPLGEVVERFLDELVRTDRAFAEARPAS